MLTWKKICLMASIVIASMANPVFAQPSLLNQLKSSWNADWGGDGGVTTGQTSCQLPANGRVIVGESGAGYAPDGGTLTTPGTYGYLALGVIHLQNTSTSAVPVCAQITKNGYPAVTIKLSLAPGQYAAVPLNFSTNIYWSPVNAPPELVLEVVAAPESNNCNSIPHIAIRDNSGNCLPTADPSGVDLLVSTLPRVYTWPTSVFMTHVAPYHEQ